MKKRIIQLVGGLFAFGMVLGFITLLSRPVETDYIPTANNDLLFTAVGFPSQQFSMQSIEAHPEQESYPEGTVEIVLVITNHHDSVLGYNGYYDFRRVDGNTVTPLSVRSDVAFDMTDKVLEPGQTVRQTVRIDLFNEPLHTGTYRAAQLACFTDTQGQAFACSEITADFTIA